MFESPDYRSQHGIITILTHGGVTLGTMPITAGSNTPTFSLVFLLSFITGAVSEARGCTHISVSANTVHWGSPLFASCTVTNTSCFGDPIIHASQIIWRLDNRDLPRTQYAIVSKTVSQLNIPAFNQSAGILSCRLHRGSPLSPQHRVRIYGGFPPEKPVNLTCVTTVKNTVSMTCSWDPGRDSRIPTNYTLRRIKNLAKCHNHERNAEWSECVSLDSHSCTVPRHMLRLFSTDDISVLAQNVLGTSESDTLCLDPMDAVKLEHPVISRVQGDSANSHCLIIHWALDINLGMMCELGYRARHGQAWRQVLVLVNDWLREQSLCQLSGGTEYRVRLRCTILGSMGHWSDWSPESSGQTSESPPVGIPDVWWHFENSDQDGKKYIRLFWKELKQSEVNGRIRGYRVSHRWEAQSSHTELTLCNTTNRTCRIPAPTGSGNICITAYNRAGESPAAELGLKTLHHRAFALLSPSVSITPINEHSLQIKWSAPRAPVTGYVVEWFEISEGVTCDINWKKESADSISSVLQENIKPMKRYAISIHPLHSKGLGIPVSTEAYSKQGAPLIGPEVSGDHIWESKAEVIWEEIPINKRQGFIRNYTIFYSDKTGPIRYIVSNALERRYTLTGLLADTDYQVQVMATTDAGGTNGSVMNLTTKKSEDGDMGTILASLCTLFLFLMSLQLLMCFIRRNVMTGNLWPKIPDPANSSLSSWIPETRHQDCKCSEGAPDSIVSSFTLLERGSDKNTAFAIKSMHLVGEEKMTSMNDDGKRPSDGECLHCLSETPACLVHTLYHNVSGGSQYASVLHYKGQKTPPPFFLRSDSTQALLHDLTPSPKPFENPWFSKSAENDSELSQDISLSDVIVGEEAIWKNFPLLWGLVSEHSGDTMVTPTASFH